VLSRSLQSGSAHNLIQSRARQQRQLSSCDGRCPLWMRQQQFIHECGRAQVCNVAPAMLAPQQPSAGLRALWRPASFCCAIHSALHARAFFCGYRGYRPGAAARCFTTGTFRVRTAATCCSCTALNVYAAWVERQSKAAKAASLARPYRPRSAA
jgi:hypothetical protein